MKLLREILARYSFDIFFFVAPKEMVDCYAPYILAASREYVEIVWNEVK